MLSGRHWKVVGMGSRSASAEGHDVVEAISDPRQDRPATDVVLERVDISD